MNYTSQKLAKATLLAVEENPKQEEKIVKNLVNFCIKKKNDYLLPRVIDFLEKENQRMKEQEILTIKSKFSLSKDMLKNIKTKFKIDGATEVQEIRDENILGGIVISFRNKIYDASLQNSLKNIRKKLT